MNNRFPSCKIASILLGFYRTWINIRRYRVEIALHFNFYFVTNFCIWPNRFFINMKSSKGDNCFKTVDHFALILRLVLLRQHVFRVSNVWLKCMGGWSVWISWRPKGVHHQRIQYGSCEVFVRYLHKMREPFWR